MNITTKPLSGARLVAALLLLTHFLVPFTSSWTILSRRKIFHHAAIVTTTATTLPGWTPSTAAAIPTNNILTNPVLEQIRIWDQDQADNIKYNGELERGNAGNRGQTGAYPRLLVPILQMARDLESIQRHVQDPTGYDTAMRLLEQPQFTQKSEFKKTFNAFADNIYYADPDRANVYLGGGATPKVEQSLAYLLRNEILTTIEDLTAELRYVQRTTEDGGGAGVVDTTEVKALALAATRAMERYLALVPPNELQQAQQILRTTSSSNTTSN